MNILHRSIQVILLGKKSQHHSQLDHSIFNLYSMSMGRCNGNCMSYWLCGLLRNLFIESSKMNIG